MSAKNLPVGDVEPEIKASIQQMVQEVESLSQRERFIYEQGRRDMFEELTRKKERAKALKILMNVADVFFKLVQSEIKGESISQLRIGINHSTLEPTVLMVVSKEMKDELDKIRFIARVVESFFWEKKRFQVTIWTIPNTSIDQDRIKTEFPYSKGKLADADVR